MDKKPLIQDFILTDLYFIGAYKDNFIAKSKDSLMKKLTIIFAIFCFLQISVIAQSTTYWSNYNYSIEPQHVETVKRILNDYWSNPSNKIAGITVSFYENHFYDQNQQGTHTISFAGTLDALGAGYAKDGGDAWKLFLKNLDQYAKVVSAASGKVLVTIGDKVNPIQNVVIMKVTDQEKFKELFTKFYSKYTPKDRKLTMGSITNGRSTSGENNYIVFSVKDVKTALDMNAEFENNKEYADARLEYTKATNDIRTVVRNHTRMLIAKW